MFFCCCCCCCCLYTFYLFIYFSFIFISWRLITLQYYSVFCHTLTWISHGFTCVPHPDPPSRWRCFYLRCVCAVVQTWGHNRLMNKCWNVCYFHLFKKVTLVHKFLRYLNCLYYVKKSHSFFFIHSFIQLVTSFTIAPCYQVLC